MTVSISTISVPWLATRRLYCLSKMITRCRRVSTVHVQLARGPAINLKICLTKVLQTDKQPSSQLRENRRNLLFSRTTLPLLERSLKGGQHPSLTTNMEIDQLTVTPISLTFRMKAFLHESDDFVPLGTPIIVFLDSLTVMENHSPVRSQRRFK